MLHVEVMLRGLSPSRFECEGRLLRLENCCRRRVFVSAECDRASEFTGKGQELTKIAVLAICVVEDSGGECRSSHHCREAGDPLMPTVRNLRFEVELTWLSV